MKIRKYSDIDELLKNKNFISFVFEGMFQNKKENFWIEIEKNVLPKKWWTWKIFFTKNSNLGTYNKWNPYLSITKKTKKEIVEEIKKWMKENWFKVKKIDKALDAHVDFLLELEKKEE